MTDTDHAERLPQLYRCWVPGCDRVYPAISEGDGCGCLFHDDTTTERNRP